MKVSVLLLSLAFHQVCSFYLPGVAPKDYKEGQKVPLLVNSLSSAETVLPYDFYTKSLHFCGSDKPENSISESLGSILFGDRLYESTIDLKMMQNQTCQKWCTSTIPKNDAKFINDLISSEYMFNWNVDGLPAAKIAELTGADGKPDASTAFYSVGFDLGELADGVTYLNNVYDITIQVHKQNDGYRVVGVLIWPISIAPESMPAQGATCEDRDSDIKLHLDDTKDSQDVTYYYNVKWKETNISWGTRWDNYLYVFDPKIHWFSLINSIVIVLFLIGMVAMILLRALHKDIARYNQLENQEDVNEDFGWKLVHGDVFRPPSRFMLLSVLVGSGSQMFFMVGVTLAFAVLGFLSPSSRGSLMTVMLIFFVLFSGIAGYMSARLYKMFGGEKWKKNVLLTAVLVPASTFGIFLILNFFLIGANSSGAVPFSTMFALISMWFLLSVPLCMVGAYLGFKKPRIENPVRTNQIPRQIPEQPTYLKPLPSIMMGGILPFGAIFIELFFIMNSIWHHRIYYVFGFLFLVYIVLILTCSGVTILMCYFHLCAEDYHWWWRAFFTSGAAAIYIFLYGVMYYFTKLSIKNFSSTVLYFGWTFTLSFLFFILTGTIGFLVCLKFVRKIYGSIKID